MGSDVRSTPLSLALRIDAVCDRFESEWLLGHTPRIEDYLGEISCSDRNSLLRGLLLVELEIREGRGEILDATPYRDRFSEATTVVDSAFVESHAAAAARRRMAMLRPATATPATERDTPPVSEETTPDLQLTRLGRFEIREVLGSGGFGMVYRAYDAQLDRDVAIKVPRADTLGSAAERERFLREARAAAHLNHPHICAVHEIGHVDGLNYIVLPFVEGSPLSRLIPPEGFPPLRASAIAHRLALALDEAHGKRIIHRDIKPSNIMIDARGEPILMDFGLARLHQAGDPQLTRQGTILGSPAYMSPEQARGESEDVGPASDIYSLGVVLYEMLCGRRPFDGTVTEILGKVLYFPAPDPGLRSENIPSNLRSICIKAMAKEPAARFASMHEFAAALAACMRNSDTDFELPIAPPSPLLPQIQFRDDGDSTECLTRPVVPYPHRVHKRLTGRVWSGGIAAVLLALGFGYLVSARDGKTAVAPQQATPALPIGNVGSDKASATDSAWRPLFNGVDLGGWEGLSEYWSVENGELLGKLGPEKLKHNTQLCTTRTYGDFELRFEVRLASGNSGVHVRSDLTDRESYNVRGPQIEISDDTRRPWGSAITEPASRATLLPPLELVEKNLRRGEFNQMLIRCIGRRIQVRLNGELLIDGHFKPLPVDGIIALQLHRTTPGMEVRFRNIEIREFPGS